VHRFWAPIIRPLLDAARPQVVVEVGALAGDLTTRLAGWAAEQDGVVVHSIDPHPAFDVDALAAEHGGRLVFHRALSHDALGPIARPDAVLLDGDHNWFTVIGELRILRETAERDGHPFPLVLLHDTGWPYGRRDLYYDAERIPEAFRQPHGRGGMQPEHEDLVGHAGLNPHLDNALVEGGERNGVLTAVEDFAAEVGGGVTVITLPALHGFTVVALEDRLAGAPALREAVEGLRSPEALLGHAEWLEQERVQAVLKAKQLARRARYLEGRLETTDLERERLKGDLARLEATLERAHAERRRLEVDVLRAKDEQRRRRVELEAERRRSAEQLAAVEEKARAADRRVRRRERELEQLRSELHAVRGVIEQVAGSRAWRYGHGTMKAMRRATGRSVRDADALQAAGRRIGVLLRSTRPGSPGEGLPDPPAAPRADKPARRRAKAAPTPGRAATEPGRRALGTLLGFRDGLGPALLSGSEPRNVAFRDEVAELERERPPKVLVGTLHGYEREFERCRQSVARQDLPGVEHLVLSGLGKKEAVATLMERFKASDADFMVKVDADMVLLQDDLVRRLVTVMRRAPEIDLLQAAILDFFSGAAMQGINTYRRSIDWRTERQDRLFTDRTFVPKDRRRVVWAPFVDAAIHSPDPSDLQAFHFGVHRGLKVLQPDAERHNAEQAAEQALYLERTWQHFLTRRDRRLALACLGYELALQGAFEVEHLDHSDPTLPQALEAYDGASLRRLESLVVEARERPAAKAPVQAVREQAPARREDADAPIRRILVLLPHFGLFGGVNRFFFLATEFERLGVECVLAQPDPDWGLVTGEHLTGARGDHPTVRTTTFEAALEEEWDAVVCGDCTSGVMLTMPQFRTRLSAGYLLNGWAHREANLRQILAVQPDVVIANSSWAARFYEDLAPVTVPGGIELDVFRGHTREPRERGAQLRVLCYAGRRKKRKRFEDVVEACRILHAQDVPVELHVYDERTFEVDLPIEVVHHGRLGHRDVAALMSGVDVMVCAEEDAGWSNPGAEALACGLPLVCTEAGTTDFAVDGETALVVGVRDPAAIAAALRRLYDDPELAAALADEGARRIEAFGWPSVARELLEVLRAVRRDGSRRRALDARSREHVAELASAVAA
jgi:hypothetical protein